MKFLKEFWEYLIKTGDVYLIVGVIVIIAVIYMLAQVMHTAMPVLSL